MPFNETFPLKDLKAALEYWYDKTNSRVTYEYVVWKGINDRKEDIEALIKFCSYIPAKVNLIEYNPIDEGEFQQASSKAIDMYINMLEAKGIVVNVRRSRGKDIDAACGQLKVQEGGKNIQRKNTTSQESLVAISSERDPSKKGKESGIGLH